MSLDFVTVKNLLSLIQNRNNLLVTHQKNFIHCRWNSIYPSRDLDYVGLYINRRWESWLFRSFLVVLAPWLFRPWTFHTWLFCPSDISPLGLGSLAPIYNCQLQPGKTQFHWMRTVAIRSTVVLTRILIHTTAGWIFAGLREVIFYIFHFNSTHFIFEIRVTWSEFSLWQRVEPGKTPKNMSCDRGFSVCMK